MELHLHSPICLHDLSMEFTFTSPQNVVKTIKTVAFSLSRYRFVLLCGEKTLVSKLEDNRRLR